jgi:hypothetical protein
MAASAQHVSPASCDIITWDGTWEGLSATKGVSSALGDTPADAGGKSSTAPQRSSVDWAVSSFEAVSDFSDLVSFCPPIEKKKKMSNC